MKKISFWTWIILVLRSSSFLFSPHCVLVWCVSPSLLSLSPSLWVISIFYHECHLSLWRRRRHHWRPPPPSPSRRHPRGATTKATTLATSSSFTIPGVILLELLLTSTRRAKGYGELHLAIVPWQQDNGRRNQAPRQIGMNLSLSLLLSHSNTLSCHARF